jgi:4'-phosphopantetheinyl transferase
LENGGTRLENLVLPENQVDIWRIDLVGQPDEIQHYRRLLSQDEIERADRFYFEKHRRRFIVARAAMRQVLGRYINVAPGTLVFSYGAKGKPELAGGQEERPIQFNLSHSDDVALLGVTQGLVLGIDIEQVNPEFSTDGIAERFFSPSEVRCLQALPADARAEAFFSCWTRKEAYIKALGEGLYVPLDSFEVAFGPGIPAALLQVRVDPREVARWSMYDIEMPAGFKAALVVEGKGHRLRHFLWRSETLS